jgi:8-amino-7-oxononanoate synthase
VGTFGKAFGASGAFVAGADALVRWLWNRARPFVFSTGLSPAVARAALDGLEVARATPALREQALRAAARFRRGLQALGVPPLGHGHVVPWVIGRSDAAVRAAAALCERGVHVRAIRPPSVPDGTSRIRFTMTAKHDDAAVDRALDALREVLAWLPR